MIAALLILCACFLCFVAGFALGAQTPYGYEDAKGFHYGFPPRPNGADQTEVVAIGQPVRGASAAGDGFEEDRP